ncbi:hypothetical protein OEA41_008711 [Lepraria neglecta]|uniref:Uncharacterized protein n=1 Tax=Lepraria neglecta TaxID=209136 RepID=A0AAD9Z4I6_9LECA|nr:hypothetical protein OEA41_008711 [Lepraria neglecta]
MNPPDMTHMPTQYLQIPSHLSQEDSHGNKSFTNAYSRRPYPLTPYPSVPETEDWSPSSLETWDHLVHTTEHEAERRPRLNAPPNSGLCHSSPTPSLDISSTELQRVLDSLLDQVDWLEVAVKVARNRAPSIYCNAIENILLAHIYQLVKIEGENDDAAQFENGNNDKNNVLGCKGDDGSEFAVESEDSDDDDDEDMEEDMNDDEYDEDSESEYNE